MREKRKA